MSTLSSRFARPIAALWMAPALMLACQGDLGVNDDDDTSTMDFEGTIMDTVVELPVSDAWIIVDTGEELISARSGGDGTFSIPDLPADDPIILTVAGEDRTALTNLEFVLSEREAPIELTLNYRSADYYDLHRVTVSGTALGVPQGHGVLLSGEGMLEYEYLYQEDTGDIGFEFDVERIDLDEPFLFTGLVYNQESRIVTAGAAEVDLNDPTVEIDLDGGSAAVELTVSSPSVLLDGEPLEELDDEYTTSLCLVYLNDSRGAYTGWTESWEGDEDGFTYNARFAPVAGYPARMAIYLSDDLVDGPTMSYTSEPLPEGVYDVTIDPLDSPQLSTHEEFGPGVTVSWDPIEGSNSQTLYVLDDDEVSWWIVTEGNEITFPTLPDGFDTTLLLDSGEWRVRARYWEEVDGEMDPDGPYRLAETLGGEL